MIYKRLLLAAASTFFIAACSDSTDTAADGAVELRMGHFPNLTHVQGLVAHHMSRNGQGWYERRVGELLGKPVRVTWYCYNAGPSAMEAIFAHSLDLTYVGPSPAINAYVKAHGSEVRIIAGAVEGGAALVAPADSQAASPQDFRGKTLATPQLGNTQDVSCRAWLRSGGLQVSLTGGDAKIMPTRNPEQLSLFAKGYFDGVWTVEPWVSRLEQAGGKIIIEEQDALTTVLAASERFLKTKPEIAAAVLTAHRELSQWIIEHPEEAQHMVAQELRELTKTDFDFDLVSLSWKRIRINAELNRALLQEFVKNAALSGFLRKEPDISTLISTDIHD